MITALLNPGKKGKKAKKGKKKISAWSQFVKTHTKGGKMTLADAAKLWKEKGAAKESKSYFAKARKSRVAKLFGGRAGAAEQAGAKAAGTRFKRTLCMPEERLLRLRRRMCKGEAGPVEFSPEFASREFETNRRHRKNYHMVLKNRRKHGKRSLLDNYHMILKNNPVTDALGTDVQVAGVRTMTKPSNWVAVLPYVGGAIASTTAEPLIQRLPVDFLKKGLGWYLSKIGLGVGIGIAGGALFGRKIGMKLAVGALAETGGKGLAELVAKWKAGKVVAKGTKGWDDDGLDGIGDFATASQVQAAASMPMDVENPQLPQPMPTVAVQTPEAQAIAEFEIDQELF